MEVNTLGCSQDPGTFDFELHKEPLHISITRDQDTPIEGQMNHCPPSTYSEDGNWSL